MKIIITIPDDEMVDYLDVSDNILLDDFFADLKSFG